MKRSNFFLFIFNYKRTNVSLIIFNYEGSIKINTKIQKKEELRVGTQKGL